MSTKFEYNSKNQLTKLTDANGNITQYEYNSFGQITKQTNAS
jgi:YD repeat-containing protein